MKAVGQGTSNGIKQGAALQGEEGAAQPTGAKEWYNQQHRQQQVSDPPEGPSTSHHCATQHAGHVKFAGARHSSSSGGGAPPSRSKAARCAGDVQQQQHSTLPGRGTEGSAGSFSIADRGGSPIPGSQQQQQQEEGAQPPSLHGKHYSIHARSAAGHGAASMAGSRQPGAGSSSTELGLHKGSHEGPESSGNSQSVRFGEPGGTLAASLRGILSQSSKLFLGSFIAGSRAGEGSKQEAALDREELWFTSLDDFKPLNHMMHRGRYMSAFFACANATGQHFVLKKYDKRKMLPHEERGVRRALSAMELLHHGGLVHYLGNWESEEAIFVVEEYVNKGDILQHCISRPELYSERHVANNVVRPLLEVLAYLHANNIIHRSVMPENVYVALDDQPRLGHLHTMVDQQSDRPKSRIGMLDYMPPEMFSVRPADEMELALLQQQDGREEEQQLGKQQQLQLQLGAAEQHQLGKQLQQQGQGQGQLQGVGREQGKQAGSRLRASAGLEGVPGLPGACSSSGESSRSSSSGGAGQLPYGSETAATAVAADSVRGRQDQGYCRAQWEQMDYYDEKVDVWQVGCLVHEILCGGTPFEVPSDAAATAGHILWSDLDQPLHQPAAAALPPDCVHFIQLALTKDPRERPSALQLLCHPWLERQEKGMPWLDPAQIEAAARAAECQTFKGACRVALRSLGERLAAAAEAVSASWQPPWPLGLPRLNRVGPDLVRSASLAHMGCGRGPVDSSSSSSGGGEQQLVSFQVGRSRAAAAEGGGAAADAAVGGTDGDGGGGANRVGFAREGHLASAAATDVLPSGGGGSRPQTAVGSGRGGAPLKSALKSRSTISPAAAAAAAAAAAGEGRLQAGRGPAVLEGLVAAAELTEPQGEVPGWQGSEDGTCVMHLSAGPFFGRTAAAAEGAKEAGWADADASSSPTALKASTAAEVAAAAAGARSPSPKLAW